MNRVRRATRQDGMTLVEVLIAMLVLAVALFALVEGLGSGILAVQRATKTSSAGVLADKQMEAFRGLTFDQIATTTAPTDGIYNNTSQPFSSPYTATAAQRIDTLGSCPGGQIYCLPTQTVSVQGGTYRIDTYVSWQCPSGSWVSTSPNCSSARAVKQVAVVVRAATTPYKTLFSETSNFDPLSS